MGRRWSYRVDMIRWCVVQRVLWVNVASGTALLASSHRRRHKFLSSCVPKIDARIKRRMYAWGNIDEDINHSTAQMRFSCGLLCSAAYLHCEGVLLAGLSEDARD